MRRPSSAPPELPGFTFIRLLGSGGFADVFLYEQQLPKRRVAVKVLLTEEITGANRTAFTAEANLMAQLSAHPYIATIYHAGVASDDRPYFVMEYCSGPSLAESYKSQTFSVEDALRVGVRLSSAVATAHAAGILHRDIKPGNVLTNDYGWPALTDFGISSNLADDSLHAHTRTLADALAENSDMASASVGMSVPWSPPEMFDDSAHPDIRSDVFSLAATVYTVIAGHTPFEVRGRPNGTLDLIGRIERGAITPIDRVDIPRSLIAVLNKGMATDAAQRFDTAVEFARALQRVELELGYSPTSIDVPNLHIAAPDHSADGQGTDETQVRSVAMIKAQPVEPGQPHTSADLPTSADETVVRGTTHIDAQPQTPPDPGVIDHTIVRRKSPGKGAIEPGTTSSPGESFDRAAQVDVVAPAPRTGETPPSGLRVRSLVIWIAAAAAAALIVIAVVGNVLVRPPTVPENSAAPSPTGGSAVITAIPTPVLASAAIEGTDLVFAVTNPDAEEGDGFVWKRSDRTASEPLRRNTDGLLVVADYAAGSTVCIQVGVLRAGDTSANLLETCYPAE